MTKITRPKLTRGTKLKKEHVHGVLSDAATQINGATVTLDQTPNLSMGVFRVNFHIPVIDSRFLVIDQNSSGTVTKFNKYVIPFTLPPTQDHWSTTGTVGTPPRFKIDKTVPKMILDELTFSFDQGAEAATRADYHFTTASYGKGINEGCLDYEEADAYSCELSLLEKSQWYFTAGSASDTSQDKRHPQKTIFTLPVDGSAFTSNVNRLNPLVVPDINHVMRPFTTYMLAITAPNLTKVGIKADLGESSPFTTSPDRSHALYSVQFSLKMKSDLSRRDVYNPATNNIRNYPTKDSSTANTIRSRAVTGNSVSITSPAANDIITADGAKGINTNVQLVDQVFKDKLSGGFNDRSETAATQELYADTCYEVLTVPLFNNAANQVYDVKTANSNGAYANITPSGGGSAYQSIADRRIIPIREPMVIHHVILARSFMSPGYLATTGAGKNYVTADTNAIGKSPTLGVEVGLGVGCGLRSDVYRYINIAYANTNPSSGTAPDLKPIDFVSSPNTTAASATDYTHDLLHVPLMYLSSGALGKGYYENGYPIYIGKSWDATKSRTQSVNTTGSLSVPTTNGAEQFLEVRIRLFNTAGNIEDSSKNDLYVGYGGYWMYIIGKKYLTKGFHGNTQGGLRMALGDFKELSVEEIDNLGPTERQKYLRAKAARGAIGSESALQEGADAQAAAAKMIPAQVRQQLATGMMGLTGGGLAKSLAAMGQMGTTITPAATIATQQGLAAAAKAKADADIAGVDAATYLAEQGVGVTASIEADIKQRIEGIKKDLRNSVTGIDSDDLAREIKLLKRFYTDDAGNIDPKVAKYIDEQSAIEEDQASGWDIF